MGSKPPSTIGTTEHWYVNAFTRGNDLPRNAQTLLTCQCAAGACPGADALRSHGSLENTGSIPTCNTSVKRVYCFYEQTNNSAVHSAGQTTHRTYQGALRVSIGHCRYSSCPQDGSAARGGPFHPTPKGTALISPGTCSINRHSMPGVLRAGLIICGNSRLKALALRRKR